MVCETCEEGVQSQAKTEEETRWIGQSAERKWGEIFNFWILDTDEIFMWLMFW